MFFNWKIMHNINKTWRTWWMKKYTIFITWASHTISFLQNTMFSSFFTFHNFMKKKSCIFFVFLPSPIYPKCWKKTALNPIEHGLKCWSKYIHHSYQLDNKYDLKTITLAIKTHIFAKKTPKNNLKSESGDTGITNFFVGVKIRTYW